jgi:hypothetical protein
MSIWEIMKREWSRMPRWAAGGKASIVGNLLALAFVACLLPLAMGRAFLEPGPLISFAVLSVFIVAPLITNCFAGEGARQDLRELAGSGSSGGAMALGKAGAAALRGWSMGLAVVLVGVVTVNLAYRAGHVLTPSPAVSAEALVLSLAASWLVALAGALISLRASSVREAQGNLRIAIVVGILVATDAVWFYPGDLLEVRNLTWMVAGLLLVLSGVVFFFLQKELAGPALESSGAGAILRVR